MWPRDRDPEKCSEALRRDPVSMHKTAADPKGAQTMCLKAKNVSSLPAWVSPPPLWGLDGNITPSASVYTHGRSTQRERGTPCVIALEDEHAAWVECFIPAFSELSNVPPKFMSTWNLKMLPYLEIGSLQV